jgi:hypothetical protein
MAGELVDYFRIYHGDAEIRTRVPPGVHLAGFQYLDTILNGPGGVTRASIISVVA